MLIKKNLPLIKKAFEAYASGKYTLKEIRKIINDLGLKGRRDSLLSVSNYSVSYFKIHFTTDLSATTANILKESTNRLSQRNFLTKCKK